jgi:hypothetical protein
MILTNSKTFKIKQQLRNKKNKKMSYDMGRHVLRGVVYNKKKREPRTEPLGTPYRSWKTNK